MTFIDFADPAVFNRRFARVMGKKTVQFFRERGVFSANSWRGHRRRMIRHYLRQWPGFLKRWNNRQVYNH